MDETTAEPGLELSDLEPLGGWRRSHTCGALHKTAAGQTVVLLGWVHRLRDHGGVVFIDLRDRHGLTQVVFRPEHLDGAWMERAAQLRPEYVIGVRGEVVARPQGAENLEMATGSIEVQVREWVLLNRSIPLPFAVADDDQQVAEDLRLRYRYLELRSERLQSILALRHRLVAAARSSLDRQGFLEIETPLLVKPTPEGARDYIVPSRLHPGKFFALPQSPQLYKQILMVAGCDRYYQIARCLRDEDPRADRQPEFSQIDLEMSFIGEEDVFAVIEEMLAVALSEAAGITIDRPFPRVAYEDAMARYGSDKPDLRLDLPMAEVTEVMREVDFRPFRSVLDSPGGAVLALRLPAPNEWASRRVIEEELTPLVQRSGGAGLGWTRFEGGAPQGGVGKFLLAVAPALQAAVGARDGDLVFFVAGERRASQVALGSVRTDIVRRLVSDEALIPRFLWIHRFPLFERGADGRFVPCHHLFTMPLESDLPRLETDPGAVHAQLYDLVLNGFELGSGSIRVHRRDIQERIMGVIGMTPEEMELRFGFLLGAFDHGAPPHGGIALGVDRLVMILAKRSSIRETIAFPKTQKASSLMDGAPAPVPAEDLTELHIRLIDNIL